MDKVKSQLNAKSIKYNCHDADVSELEGVFARGDRRLNDVILQAYQEWLYSMMHGAEYFHYDCLAESIGRSSGSPWTFYNDKERSERRAVSMGFY